MKAQYSNVKEIAELYISSGEKDRTDVQVLINEAGKKFVEKVGRQIALNVLTPFMQNKESLYTVNGLTSYLQAVGVNSINFADPITGKIESTVYINL